METDLSPSPSFTTQHGARQGSSLRSILRSTLLLSLAAVSAATAFGRPRPPAHSAHRTASHPAAAAHPQGHARSAGRHTGSRAAKSRGAIRATGTYRENYRPAPAVAAPLAAAPQPQVADDAPAISPAGVRETLAQGGTALRFPTALQGFFNALRQREDEPGNGTVRVMQWGDSHTAADMFTGELRARMQSRFGDGGVGFTYAGHPFAGYRILGSGRGQSGSWRTLGTHFTDLGDRLLGLGGVAIETFRPGDTASLDAPCLTFDLQYLRQPNGGTLQVSDNGQLLGSVTTADNTAAPVQPATGSALPAEASQPDPEAAIDNSSATPEAADGNAQSDVLTGTGTATAGSGGNFHTNCAPGTHHFTVTTSGGGPVRLLGTVALQPGITWEAMGINGAEAPLMLRWNQPLFQGYLAAAQPALIVLAYGTNEAAARWTGEEYRATFSRLIDTLHRTSPRASILVLGPGDRSLGSTYYTTSYSTVGRGRRARRVAHRVAHRTYTPYRGTDRILNAQQSVCSTTGLCAFWDWRARQGGFGSMNRWVGAGYAQPDHTHLTGTGYRALADSLAADLLSAYSQFHADRNGSPSVP